MEKISVPKPLSVQIREMEVGEMREFPLDKLRTVRVYACVHGLEAERKYKTTISRERRTVIVTREN